MLTVWLIRHAESQANAGGRTSVPAEIPLTSRGQEQAQYLASAVLSEPQLVVTSPYLRTKQTALPLMQRFPYIAQAEWPVQEFTYLSSDRCQNTTTEERLPWVTEYWTRNDPAYVDGYGAESFMELMSRVESLIENLKALENEFTVIFSHGQFIRSLMWRLVQSQSDGSPIAMRHYRNFITSFEFPNAAIARLQVDDDRTIWMRSVDNSHIPLELRTL